MENSKHTKGEWVINKHSATTVELKGSSRSIASTGGYQSNQNSEVIFEENLANAKLIASAPELLEALQNIQHILVTKKGTMKPNDVKMFEYCNNAIQKATE